MNILYEENGIYALDCSKAIWASDKMNEDFHKANVQLSDADFLIEDESVIMAIEYKNACVENASKPEKFKPSEDKYVLRAVRKFYDSLHYLHLLKKDKPVNYIYVVEYPSSDVVTRARLRDLIKKGLPFALQENLDTGVQLINKFEVLSIDEWNNHEIYGVYPLKRVEI